MKRLLLIISFFIFQKLSAQIPDKYPFVDQEKVNYTVYYNLAWVWVRAADVTFFVSDSVYQKKKAIYFSSIGNSRSSYDWIFRVRDRFSSFVEPVDMKPLFYRRDTEEGSHKLDNRYYFQNSKERILSFINDSDKEKSFQDTLNVEGKIFDILSATYYLRTINFEEHRYGDTIPVKTVMDNEIIYINVVFLGQEDVLHKNEKTYSAYKFKTKGVEGSIFDEKSEMVVWVSKDKNKIPLKIETKILVGSIKAFVSQIENPKEVSPVIKDFIVE